MDSNQQTPIHLMSGRPDWHKKPFLLNLYELKYPIKAVEAYHDRYPLMDIRASVRNLVKDATNTELPSGNDHVGFGHDTEKFIEAIYWMLDQGTLITSEIRQKREAFIARYLEETAGLMAEMKLMLETVPRLKRRASDKDSFISQIQQYLKKIHLISWEIDTAHLSMSEMVKETGKESMNNNQKPNTFKTANFIRRWVEPFYGFKKAFNRRFEVQIARDICPKITCWDSNLAITLESLLFTAFQFCNDGGYVLLDCASLKDSISMTITFTERLVENGILEDFHAYELLGNSAVAGAHLYISKAYATEMKASLQCWSHENKTSFRLVVPCKPT